MVPLKKINHFFFHEQQKWQEWKQSEKETTNQEIMYGLISCFFLFVLLFFVQIGNAGMNLLYYFFINNTFSFSFFSDN